MDSASGVPLSCYTCALASSSSFPAPLRAHTPSCCDSGQEASGGDPPEDENSGARADSSGEDKPLEEMLSDFVSKLEQGSVMSDGISAALSQDAQEVEMAEQALADQLGVPVEELEAYLEAMEAAEEEEEEAGTLEGACQEAMKDMLKAKGLTGDSTSVSSDLEDDSEDEDPPYKIVQT